MPVEKCCPALKIAWDNDMIGIFVYSHNNKPVMTWKNINNFESSSPTCVFCKNKLVTLPKYYKKKMKRK
jgi:hypothetical protein